MPHKPVMLAEMLEALSPADGKIYVDGTFGGGGYSRAILEAANCTVIAIDRDLDACKRAQELQTHYGKRLIFIRGCFGDMKTLLEKAGYAKIDGFILDLGVSSFQLDEKDRGFSFRCDGPLDMRMDTQSATTAADIVNGAAEKELADLIYRYGQERKSRSIARRIVERRQEKPFKTTTDLALLVREIVPRSRKDHNDPATRTFQALRIAVNDELGELERALAAARDVLSPGGRLVVVSFHSLEDGIVKSFLRGHSDTGAKISRHMPEPAQAQSAPPAFTLLSKKALFPREEEKQHNPRARSARLRAALRTEAA